MAMTRHNQHPSPEYLGLVESIEEFVQENSFDDGLRAAADGLEDGYREQFKAGYAVETTANTACIGRLIEGWSMCKHGWHQPRDGSADDQPPCKPPHADHADLWLRDGEPAAYSMHLYDVDQDVLGDLFDFAEAYGLEVAIEPSSWYFPGQTTQIVFYTARSGE